MTAANFKTLIGFDALTKDDLLLALMKLGENVDGFPGSLAGQDKNLTKGQAFAIMMLLPHEKQLRMSIGDTLFDKVKAFKDSLDPTEVKQAAGALSSI
jgi:hypothetical protein